MGTSLRRRTAAASLLAFLAASACGKDTTTSNEIAGPPARLEAASGNEQTGEVGTELSGPLVVSVVDARGRSVPRQVVTFEIVAGGGSVAPASATTGEDGLAQVRWTLGTASAEAQRVTATIAPTTAGAASLTATFEATASPGAATKLLSVSAPAAIVAAGVTLPDPVVVRAADRFGNGVPNVSVSWRVSEAAGTVQPTTSVSDSEGLARTSWTVGSASGANTLSAAAAGVEAATFSVTTSIPYRAIKRAGDAQAALPNTTLPIAPAVTVQDVLGRPVAGVPVTFTVTSGGGRVTGGTAISNATGVAAVGSWTLGPQPGLNTLVVSSGALPETAPTVIFTAAGQGAPSANIRVSFGKPIQRALVGDLMELSIGVTSLLQVVTVTARVADRVVALKAQGDGQWVGVLDLRGLPRGPLSLIATATDVAGGTGGNEQQIIYDNPPRVTVTQPTDGTVARPTVRIVASCADDDPAGCSRLRALVTGHVEVDHYDVLVTATSAIDQEVSLAAFDGRSLWIVIEGRDSAGQIVYDSTHVISERSASLVEVTTVPGFRILDSDGTRVLYIDRSTGTWDLKLRSGSAEVVLFSDPNATPIEGFLTLAGAIFVTQGNSSPQASRVRALRYTQLEDLGPIVGRSLRSAGKHALWNNGSQLIRYDVEDGTTVIVPGGAGTLGDLAVDGSVAVSIGGAISLWRDGSLQPITNPQEASQNLDPVTDGVHVVYRRRPQCCAGPFEIRLTGPAGTIVLGAARTIEPQPGTDYQINNGWVAFTEVGTDGHLQVWLRSPTGERRQVSAFGDHSFIETLGRNGEVVFRTATRRYATGHGGTLVTHIGALVGQATARHGQILVLIGGTVFRVGP